ncbi:hypothetical protein ACFOU0_05955 [Salinicoccus sesuvii]|uniref:Uncharacterized protein n=1 Tax=Salinicoccus sesuvii TaxID=868281 RepID=A0ABV7N6M5_9STAP
MGIKQKGRIGQFFCSHKNNGWFKKVGASHFSALNGERRYQICKDCGKEINSFFAKYEGNGLK